MNSKRCKVCKTKEKHHRTRNTWRKKIYKPQKRLDEVNVNAFRIEKQQITNEISIINLQRDEIFEYKTKGSIIRSRTRWYNDDERKRAQDISSI